MPDEAKNPDQLAEGETAKAEPSRSPSRPPNMLSRPTDAVARPGFRNPANQKSKAQKKGKGKKR